MGMEELDGFVYKEYELVLEHVDSGTTCFHWFKGQPFLLRTPYWAWCPGCDRRGSVKVLSQTETGG